VALIKRQQPYPCYSDYRKYKPHLRRDFSYCCAYCTIHENEWGGLRHFQVEHFRPKSRFPQLVVDYENLLYACDVCNCYKGDDWPSDDPLTDGVGYLDPCQNDYDEHFRNEQATGQTNGLTAPARYMIERLHLNRGHLIRVRQKRRREEELHQRFLQQTDDLLAMIKESLEDKALSEHVLLLLRAFQEHLQQDREQRIRWWKARWEPPYEPNNLH
jgi:uncharacterized protein (TIGR02646 family)